MRRQVLRRMKVRKRVKSSVSSRLRHLVLEFHGRAAAIVDDPVDTEARRNVECKPTNHEGQELEDLLGLLLGRVIAGRGLEQLLADALRHDQDDGERKVGCRRLPSESRVSVARKR